MAKRTNITKRIPLKFQLVDLSLIESKKLIEESFDFSKAGGLFYSMDVTFEIDKKKAMVKLDLIYKFHGDEMPLYQIQTSSSYLILEHSASHLADEEARHEVLVQLTEILVNHTRGMQAISLSGSILKKYYIPILDKKKLNIIIRNSRQKHVSD